MVVNASHRETTGIYQTEVYHQLAQDCVTALRNTKCVSSVVLCGSVVKADIIPGWSDLDIIIFLPPLSDGLSSFQLVRKALTTAKRDIEIGLGVDIVFEEEFKRTSKLCGRPLAMSYEVAAYGETRFGPNPFESLPPIGRMKNQLLLEHSFAVSVELHNWRRAFLVHDQENPNFKDWTSRCVKTMLKLLKYETDPSTEPPFTYQTSLERLRLSNPFHLAMPAFTEAVRIRKNWLTCLRDKNGTKDAICKIVTALADYPSS